MTTISSSSRPFRRRAAVTVPSGGRERLWIPAAVVAAVVIAVASWVLLVAPVRSDTSMLSGQAATVTQQVDTLRSQLAQLKADQTRLPTYRAELAAASAALPTTAALPTFLRTLEQSGTAAGVDVTALTAQAPTAIAADGTPVAGSSGVSALYQVAISVTAEGSYDAVTAFVRQLQQVQPRAVLVSDVSTQANATGTTLTLAMSAFFAPGGGSTAGS